MTAQAWPTFATGETARITWTLRLPETGDPEVVDFYVERDPLSLWGDWDWVEPNFTLPEGYRRSLAAWNETASYSFPFPRTLAQGESLLWDPSPAETPRRRRFLPARLRRLWREDAT